MRLFFYDLTVDREAGDVVYMRFLNDKGEKVCVRVQDVRKYVYVLPAGERNDASLLRFMRAQTSALPEDVLVDGVVERRYIISENHALSARETFIRLSCSARHDWNFSRETVENCPLMSNYLGGDHTIVEQLINEYQLHAWTVLDTDYLSPRTLTCSASMLRKLIISTGDSSQEHPYIAVAIVCKDLETDLYTVYNHARRISYSPLNEQNARRMLSVVNPVVTAVHGTSTFVNSTAESAGIVINTMELDKIPCVVKSTKDILSVLARHKFIELSLDLTVYTWQPWSQTVKNSMRLLRVEWMLYKRFFECNVLPPSKNAYRRKEEYQGGLVLPASIGIHDDSPVLLFDFLSLFPSLCVEYSICWSENGELLPAILKDLIEQRKALRGQVQSEIRRLVLKLLANTTYGCMAATSCRYYSPYIAERITRLSRQALQDTADAVQSPMATVIYGDTDSVFVKVAHGIDAQKYAQSFVSMINRRYRYLELEHESTYRLIAFVSKKCYVAFPANERLPPTIKGLKMIKSEYCLLGRYLVETIIKRLGHRRTAEHIFTRCEEEVRAMINDLNTSRTALEDLTMTRRLNKRINDYSTRGVVPYHVQAALHDRKKHYVQGEYIRYVMIEGKMCICAENMNATRKIDVQWYCSQIHGMVEQLLELLPGYDASRFHELFLLTSSSSSIAKPKIDYQRHGLSIQCQQCNTFTVHYGLYPLERLLEQQCTLATVSTASPTASDDDSDEYVMDQHHVISTIDHNLKCARCKCSLNLKTAIKEALCINDPWQLASLQLNYDCKRILSLCSCIDCRRRILEALSEVRHLYTDLLEIID